VLCFYAYWKEEIFDSNERFRYRLVSVFYVVEDGTVKVSERKTQNAGMPQGVFLKRGLVPKVTGGVVTLDDIKIGEPITLYNRTFHLYGCNKETRAWCHNNGRVLPADLPVPEDDFVKRVKSLQTDTNKLQKTPMKIYTEALCGKAVGAVEKLGSFLEHGRKVLRFHAYWDDRKSLYGELNRYVMHYFLADNTIEILEVKTLNSGKGDFPLLLARKQLPKDWETDIYMIDKNNESSRYVSEKDLYIGAKVRVYGKSLILTKCDGATQRYYMEKYGVSAEKFEPILLDADRPAPPRRDPKPMPYTGGVASFGTEDDSLQSCLSLHPKPMKKDVEKQMANQKNLLRFLARMDTTKPEDKNRRFVITYYMADDTLAIFEEAHKNNGIIPGKFLKRSRFRNPDTGRFYLPQDFQSNKMVTINHFRFIVENMDKFTQTFTVDVKETLTRLHRGMVHTVTSKGVVGGNSDIRKVRSLFNQMDADGSGFITITEMENYIRNKLVEHMQPKEIEACMAFFDTDRDGRVSLDEFKVWLLSDVDDWGEIGTGDTIGDFSASYQSTLAGASSLEGQLQKTKIALKRYAIAFQDKTHNFNQIFHKYDKRKSGLVNKEQFMLALKAATDFSYVKINPAYSGVLADYLFPEDCRNLEYKRFIELLKKQDIPPIR